MFFSDSLVNHGTGKYIVCDIGIQTEIGKIASLLDNTSIICCSKNFLDALMMAVALAVAAIPEALSSIVTIILSLST